MITIDEVATARAGREIQTAAEFAAVDLRIFGGCQNCGACIAAYNAYPTKTGFWGCEDCTPTVMGFETVEEFERFLLEQRAGAA